ncbi:hypothetical protein [Conexibacter sp. S30A1]|jgi:hypothetical protein|uniref:hypothetical protein n=1 Tax=Conexibacter sp. S30A1 TaxID=2937800 RepID=UPI002010204A|nr:hypothetical protein [Conexibacter sp. S30A1]
MPHKSRSSTGGFEVRVYIPAELHGELAQRARTSDRKITGETLRAVRAYLADYDRLQTLLEAQALNPANGNGPA